MTSARKPRRGQHRAGEPVLRAAEFPRRSQGYAQAGAGGDPTLILLRYGVSLYHSGDKSGAERQLRTVASTRPEALKYLAYIQKDFGDVAQSMTDAQPVFGDKST